MISSGIAPKPTDGESRMKGLTKSTNVFTIIEDHGRRGRMYFATEGEEWDLGFPIISIRGHWVSCLCVCVCVGGNCGAEKNSVLYIKNNFRPTLLDFEGFFSKPKELLEMSVFFSLSFSLSILI